MWEYTYVDRDGATYCPSCFGEAARPGVFLTADELDRLARAIGRGVLRCAICDGPVFTCDADVEASIEVGA